MLDRQSAGVYESHRLYRDLAISLSEEKNSQKHHVRLILKHHLLTLIVLLSSLVEVVKA